MQKAPHADNKHDHRGQRCINGSVGLRVPSSVKNAYCAKYMRKGKPIHLTQRVNDDAYSIVAQYQAEYRGIVQYYRMAYNLHTLGKLRRMMELSLVKTLAKKYKDFMPDNLQAILHLHHDSRRYLQGASSGCEKRREEPSRVSLWSGALAMEQMGCTRR